MARRPANPDAKKLAGTFRKDRHADIVPLTITKTDKAPEPPIWLSEGAKEVWKTDLGHAVACGATAIDSGMFAVYCETMASFVADVKNGVPSNAAFRSELRKQLELLGMAGPKSRLMKLGGSGTKAAEPSNPFTARPK